MIKINVITNISFGIALYKKPNNYIDEKVKKINLKTKNFIKRKLFCNLLLSFNKKIKFLNKKFRKKNKTTDVLSFPFNTKKDLNNLLKKEKEIYLGDIIINLNEIKSIRDPKNFKKAFDNLWVHGLVHLFGHDHKKEKDFQKMNKIEKKYISLING